MEIIKISFPLAFLSALINISVCATLNTACESLDNNVWTCDNIPLDIPKEVTSVHIKDFMSKSSAFEINFSLFHSDNWKYLKTLKFSDVFGSSSNSVKFKDGAFRNSLKLEVLQVHSESAITFEPCTLCGLRNVKILDFSGCTRFRLEEIAAALNGSEKVPNLEQLLLSSLNYVWSPLTIDKEFSRCLSQKPIFHLDLSKTRVSVLEMNIIHDLKQLNILNISRAMIMETSVDGVMPDDLKHIHMIDMSHAIVDTMWSRYNFQNFSLSNVNIPLPSHYLRFFVSPEIINLSSLVSYDSFFFNTKASSVEYVKSWSKELILMNNKIRRLDIDFVCGNLDFKSVQLFNLANNGMEYIHPSILDCMSNLEYLDISDNKLYIMYVENIQLFAQIFKTLKKLKNIQLASNHLTDIPEDMFAGNGNIEVINLEGNRLTHVHFKLHNLHKLLVLNLMKNSIKVLDEASMHYLDSLNRNVQSVEVNTTDMDTLFSVPGNLGKTKVGIKFNPLMCDKCEALHSIQWLLNTELINTYTENITCKGEFGELINVKKDAATMVQSFCDRSTRNILLISTTAVFTVVCIGVVVIVQMRKKRLRKQAKRNDIINMLRVDEGRFCIFLSYSSDDEDFVLNNVVGPLNEGLQEIVDTDRNLVCRGDAQFRPGQYVYDESLRCIEQSNVFLGVISNNYCNGGFCEEEFNQAIQTKTPIMLMAKEDVNVARMSSAMKLLFRNKVRILWENNDGEYRLKTSWENVCESILNLAAN